MTRRDDVIRFVPDPYPIGFADQGDVKHIVIKGANVTDKDIDDINIDVSRTAERIIQRSRIHLRFGPVIPDIQAEQQDNTVIHHAHGKTHQNASDQFHDYAEQQCHAQ